MNFKELINKFNGKTTLDKEKLLLLIRWTFIVLVFLWWWFTSNSSIGIALILVLSSTTLIRMQFSYSVFFIIIEILMCFLCFPYWTASIFGLILPVFEAGVTGAIWTLSVVLAIIFLKISKINIEITFMLCFMAFFMGYIIKAWSDRENLYVKAMDSERKQRYELEQLKNELIAANNEMAKLVETTERNRIAQQLHDNVGHEIAGALIALQTYKKLEENNDKRAKEMLENVLKRVESSSIKLRETVYQLKPSSDSGSLRLQKLCESFIFCNINCIFVGDKERVPAIVWVILEPCLKEALTNITKYSKATDVEVSFDITEYIIRMNIKDNGIGVKEINSGFGIFGITERIRAAGGNVSIDSANGFMITCILPIDIY
jgi:two-component system, NarL family, sensor histidine kinase DesK